MSRPSDRPNVVFVITDQQRADHLGCTGDGVLQTPTLDRLADEGIRFDRHYTNHPICTPSRATLITGRYPRSTRVYDNGCVLPETETTLPQVLSRAGYRTRAVGKLHLTPWRDPEGRFLESYTYWPGGNPDGHPEPYVGFDGAEVCMGHISHDVGHYGAWLKRTHPEVYDNWSSYLHEHTSGMPGCQRWTMPPQAHANTWIADRCCTLLEEFARQEQPFFLHVGFPDPHHPFRAPEPWGSRYDPADITLRQPSIEPLAQKPPEYLDYMHGRLNEATLGAGDFNSRDLTELTDDQLKQMIATTYGMVSFIDQQLGRIMDTLRRTGLDDNTMVVYTSDHGDLMGDHRMIQKGPFLLEGITRVPMIVRPPGGSSPRTTSALTSHVDVLPTLAALLGVQTPTGVEGRSFAEVVAGHSDTCRDRVLVEFLHQFQLDRNLKCVVTERHKLVYWGGQPYGELYDLEADPLETVNLWDDPGATEVKHALMHAMLDELVTSENILPLPPAVS